MREALGGMTAIPQWFVWFLQWEPAEGKYKKLPFSPTGSGVIDNQRAENWMTYDQCDAAVRNLRASTPADASYTWTHGFLFTKGCGYWFLDADKAIDNGQYVSEIHPWIIQNLPGAAFEISSSGRGYHLFGRGQLSEHACKVPKVIREGNPLLRELELYTESRGVAFGLNGQMSGNADTDHTVFFNQTFIPAVFPKSHEDDIGDMRAEDYRDAPQDERWIGPSDDEDLIRRAMGSASTSDKIQGHAGLFAALWTNNAAELGARYPGESEKDMALIAQLAFWTGKNPARIERLMLRSALVREKWKERRGNLTWLQYSILEQLRKPMNVLQDKRVEDPTEQTATPGEVSGHTFIGRDDLPIWFKDCVYVLDANMIYTPIRGTISKLLNQERFEAMRGGRVYITDAANTATTKKAWDAFLKNQVFSPPRVDGTCFRPDVEGGAIVTDPGSGETSVNLWVKPVVEAQQGDPAWFLALITRLLPNVRDQRIMLSYMASMVRNPGVKFRWCPVLQGTKGNGKSTVGEILTYCIGSQYATFPTTKQLTGKFNDWQLNKLLAVVNDVSIDARHSTVVIDALRPMITDTTANIEGKGVSISTRRTCLNYFMTMNRPDGIPKDEDERRFAIFFSAQQNKGDVARDFPGTFFLDLRNWLDFHNGYAICAWYLQNYEIAPEFDPMITQRAPETSTEDQVKAVNATPLAQVLKEFVGAGVPGFMEGWVSLTKAKEMANSERVPATLREVRDALTSLGYIPHPGLGAESRIHKASIIDDNRRVCVWVREDHYSLAHIGEGPARISQMYIRDNSPAAFGTLIPQ